MLKPTAPAVKLEIDNANDCSSIDSGDLANVASLFSKNGRSLARYFSDKSCEHLVDMALASRTLGSRPHLCDLS